ncbi:hypothetical protein SCHPADRAFT_758029 [Schizopora paradoxa]|uniref:Uncharacterized protein n=1 Tax=Schizopora paradoxa TaxID=27342 RepID=A0A0H2QXD2_9AGAM|nr:hypothetical protein SCHPADRAFT_758029 [Schizopora paradoxa]
MSPCALSPSLQLTVHVHSACNMYRRRKSCQWQEVSLIVERITIKVLTMINRCAQTQRRLDNRAERHTCSPRNVSSTWSRSSTLRKCASMHLRANASP